MLFNCDWIDGRDRAIKIDEYDFTVVNLNCLLPGPNTFALESNVHHVNYVRDPIQHEWHVAVKTRPLDFFDMDSVTNDEVITAQNLDQLVLADEDVEVRTDMHEILKD